MGRCGDAGGSLALAELIDQHGGALAWDLTRAGQSLWDLVTDLLSEAPTYTPRYVLSLLEWVPEDGAFAASVRGGRHWLGWTRATQLAADTFDLHAAVAFAKGGKKARGKAPTYPRPKAPPRTAGNRRRLADFPGAIDVRHLSPTGRAEPPGR